MQGSTTLWGFNVSALTPGVDVTQDIGDATHRIRDLWASSQMYPTGAAHATPAAGHVVTYAKTDKKMYSKDDAGVETPLGGSTTPAVVPLWLENARFPDGTTNNLYPSPMERISTGTPPSNIPKFVELVYSFDQTIIQHLVWKGVIPLDFNGGIITLVTKWSIGVTTGNMRVLAGFGVVVDGVTSVGTVVANAADITADQAVPATAGQQKETRLVLNGTNAAPGRKFVISVSLTLALSANAAASRILEAAWLEFAR
jgi:hypothetical protein